MSDLARTPVAQKARQAQNPAAGGLLQRQCACGNHTVAGGECAACAKKQSGLQRKLTIGASNDPLEQEADRVADQVMAAPIQSAVSGASPRIQRFTGQATDSVDTAPASVDRALASPGRPLEPALQQEMGQRFGYDFSSVRVHSGSEAEQSARDVSANAYTVGHNIVFGAGRFAPGTQEGRRLVAHELTHVVQHSGLDYFLARQTASPPRTPNVYSPELTEKSPNQRSVSPLRAIARDFRAKVDADPTIVSHPSRNITDTGQNFWTDQIWDRILILIATGGISAAMRNDFVSLTRATVKQDSPTVASLKKTITQNPAFRTDKKAQTLLHSDPDPRSGKELYEEWWSTYRTKKVLPNLANYLTIPILNKINIWEVFACGYTVNQVVDVQKSRGGTGKGTRNPKNAFFGEQLSVSSTAWRDTCRITSDTALGDLVRYKPLQSIIDKMKIALDDGFVLYTHVLSGYGLGSQAPMTDCNTSDQHRKNQAIVTVTGEHYILIIGHENNRFLFWDAHVSDSKEFGGGFGSLFFDASSDNSRLSTAETDSDLPVNTKGEQSNGQHRYQPLTISTK